MVFDSLELDEWIAGEAETLRSFGISHLKELDNRYIKWLKNLTSYHVDEKFIFVHAGLNFSQENPLNDEQSMRWIINWYETIDHKWLQHKTIIHGHQVIGRDEILKMKNDYGKNQVINIDNGCYLKGEANFGNLCCLNLTTMELMFQENID
jgi:serine/threonine protein phosphatase 1